MRKRLNVESIKTPDLRVQNVHTAAHVPPERTRTLHKSEKSSFCSPLSQELLNSVRRGKSELRRTTGSEPKKLMDVAEYRSFPVQQEQDMRENSWRSIIHNEFKQYLIYVPTMNSTSVDLRAR